MADKGTQLFLYNQFFAKKLYASLCPVATVKASVADGFGDMVALHFLRIFKVGNGTGNFENAGVGAGRKFQAFHCHTEHFHRWLVGFGIFMQHLLSHHGIGMDAAMLLETLFLHLAGFDDTFADSVTAFAWLHLGEFGKRHSLDFAMDVYSV